MTSSRYLLVLLISTWAIGCVAPSRTGQLVSESHLQANPARTGTIYLIRHGWHTGLALKRAEIPASAWPESQLLEDANFIEVGWGDEAYLRSSFMNPFVMLNAAFLPSRSAIHVAGIRHSPENFFAHSQIVKIPVTDQQMHSLCRFIHDSYARDDTGCASVITDGNMFVVWKQWLIGPEHRTDIGRMIK